MIEIFTTGGTIDKVYFDALSEYQIGPAAIPDMLRENNVHVPHRVTQLMRKDSLELDDKLAALPADAGADDIQNIVYEIGKNEAYGFENLRDWFKALYETLLGSSAGPRMGSFIALFGIDNTRRLIAEALA